jgi:alkaline phosphatase D
MAPDNGPGDGMGITGDWDRRISRRTLLRTGGTLAAGLTLTGGLASRAQARPWWSQDVFSLGIASGDPLPDAVVLWTRLAPDPLAPDGGMGPEPYGVRYEVATDERFRRIVKRGAVEARPDEAHSVHVELTGLRPSTEYFYRFRVGREESVIGRTRTAPPAGSIVEQLKFAFVSCQNYPIGYFNSYADIAAQVPDIDLVVHLGDYIYEGDAASLRQHAPLAEIFSLSDYRIRHAQYKTDLDLQAAHAALPWFVTWDDHEVDNNYADEEADPDMPPEAFLARRAAAYRAYWEHMPLRRRNKPVGPDLQLYRRYSWGSLATFNVLDGRQYRSNQPAACSQAERVDGYCPGALDPSRTKLGAEQKQWLFSELATTRARWNILAQQTAFAPFDRDPDPAVRNAGTGDNWDGYVAERQELIDLLASSRTPNPIVITGDSHANWVRNVPPDYRNLDAPPVATEFMGTSISSGGDPSAPYVRFADDPNNPHIVFRNNNRGYVRCTIGADAWTSEYRIVPTVKERGVPASTLATFAVEDGRPGAVPVSGGV